MAFSSNNIYFAGGRELKEIIKFLSTPAIRAKVESEQLHFTASLKFSKPLSIMVNINIAFSML